MFSEQQRKLLHASQKSAVIQTVWLEGVIVVFSPDLLHVSDTIYTYVCGVKITIDDLLSFTEIFILQVCQGAVV